MGNFGNLSATAHFLPSGRHRAEMPVSSLFTPLLNDVLGESMISPASRTARPKRRG
jgi:hypothetical protein